MEYDQRIVLERGFEGRIIMNIVNGNNEAFDVNIPFVRDAILYYTIQQYFIRYNNILIITIKKLVSLFIRLKKFMVLVFKMD